MVKKKILNLFLLLFVIILTDLIAGYIGKYVVNKVAEKPHGSQAALIAYNIEGAKADVVIVGSSTATCHIIPSILSDSLSTLCGSKLTSFNAGAYYQGIPYCKAIVKGVFERCHPRIIIMDIQPEQLFLPMTEAQEKPLRPYYNCNENIKNILDENSDCLEKAKLKSNLYCYNCEIIKLLFAMRTAGVTSASDVSGFDRHDESLDEMPKQSITSVNPSARPTCINDLYEIVNLCNTNNCELFLVISPFLNHIYSSDYYINYLRNFCRKNNIYLLDYLGDKSLQNYKLFRDGRHLNYQGAQKLTKLIYKAIKTRISNNKIYTKNKQDND